MRLFSTALCCSLAAGLACAQTELYIAEYQFNSPRMSAVQTDGTNPRTMFNPATALWLPIGLSVNTTTNKLFWVDSAGTGKVRSANLDGSAPTQLTSFTGTARGASLDAQGRVYFGAGTTLRRINADGTGLVTLFTATGTNPVGAPRVDATNGHVYLGADGQIIRLDLDGSNQKVVVNGVSQPRSIGLDIAGNHIYWIDADTITDFIGRAKLDGTDFTILVDNSPNLNTSSGLSDLVVDVAGNAIFYADDLRDNVTRVDLSGQNPLVVYTSQTGRSPSGLVLSTGEPVQAIHDLDANGVPDDIDIQNGAADCDNNGVPDSAQVDPCPTYNFALDQGSDAALTTGRAVGVPSQWKVFQPFDVPAGGWKLGKVGLDGYTSSLADKSGLTLRVYPDNGTGTAPDEGNELASARLDLLFNTFRVNWVYAPLAVDLPQGRHWARVEANSPLIYGASINTGFTGLPSKSRGSSGVFGANASPIALRLILKPACIADVSGDGTVDLVDFFQFLNDFDISAPGADVDGVPGVDLGDFFAFLNAFDVGC